MATRGIPDGVEIVVRISRDEVNRLQLLRDKAMLEIFVIEVGYPLNEAGWEMATAIHNIIAPLLDAVIPPGGTRNGTH